MPANPNDPMPLKPLNELVEKLKNFDGLNNASQNNGGWWNYIDPQMVDWSDALHRIPRTALLFKAAAENKVYYSFVNKEYLFKLEEGENLNNKILSFLNEFKHITNVKLIFQSVPFEENFQEGIYKFYANNDTFIAVNIDKSYKGSAQKNIILRAYSLNPLIVNKVKDIAKKYLVKNSGEPDLYTVVERDHGLSLAMIGRSDAPIIRSNYSKKVLDDFDYVVKQFNDEKPFGRLAILHGPPGTGKTHLLKGFLSKIKLASSKFIFLQPQFLFRYGPATFTKLLLDVKEDVQSMILFIEDADDCLVPRQSDNIAAISTLLNLADGFIGDMLDIRIIVTTNSPKLDIDSALKRPGRLCKIISVDRLEPKQVEHIVKRETGKIVPQSQQATLADAYNIIYRINGTAEDVEVPFNTIGFSKDI